MLSIPVETSEEIEAKKIALIKQERRNERERVRRWRLHQQNMGRQKINDITQAINCIQEQQPVEISIEEKCKIYAVLSDLAFKEKQPLQNITLTVAALDFHYLDKCYEQLTNRRS